MESIGLVIVCTAFLLYAVVSGRLAGGILTAPMLFAAFGFLIGPDVLDLVELDMGHNFLHVVGEITLIVLLFSDAARIDLKQVRSDHNLPLRMLTIGLPLTIVLGLFFASVLFPELSFWEAALLAALLAPTDAALGQAVVSNPAVPLRIRQAINIESGLNDGIALPAVLLFAALAGAAYTESSEWITFGLMQITLGPLTGAIVGYLGAKLIDRAAETGSAEESYQGIAILALAGVGYLLAEAVGGNGFIAAFVGGMVFGNTIRNQCNFLFEFMETEGQLLMLITFLAFGMALLPEGLASITPMHVVYAVLSLTVIRMLPVAISLIRSGVSGPTVLFLGWFGPRGLASILFVLLILEEAEIMHEPTILAVTVVTVAFSIVLHGISAAPFAKRYGQLTESMGECEEMRPVTDMPLRDGMATSDLHRTDSP